MALHRKTSGGGLSMALGRKTSVGGPGMALGHAPRAYPQENILHRGLPKRAIHL
jgi:hypothetical protein